MDAFANPDDASGLALPAHLYMHYAAPHGGYHHEAQSVVESVTQRRV